jgi:hypothetical protein
MLGVRQLLKVLNLPNKLHCGIAGILEHWARFYRSWIIVTCGIRAKS